MTATPQHDDTAARLIDALNSDRFVLHQQPIVPIASGSRDDAYQEIFVRFKEEEEKLLPPGTFIPILESSHLMHLLDRWVVNRVIKWIHAGRRHDSAWSAPCCSINLSNDSLTHPDFPHFVIQQLQKGRVSGRKLAFEIAEEDAHEHKSGLESVTRELRPLGCRFTLTSYNGHFIVPGELKAHGVESVKMDVDIVTTLHSSRASLDHAQRLQQACTAAGVHTIGEFVEKPETLQHLKKLGVHYAQGWGIGHSEPLYAKQVEHA